MSETPRLSIESSYSESHPDGRHSVEHAVTLDGIPLTDEENEAAAARILASRKGWQIVQEGGCGAYGVWEGTDMIAEGPTPAAAYRAATRDEES